MLMVYYDGAEMADFIVEDEDSDIPAPKPKQKKKPAAPPPPPPPPPPPKTPSTSTSKFAWQPKTGGASSFSKTPSKPSGLPNGGSKTPIITPGKGKGKDDVRYPWLVDIKDADGNLPDHPDYDPRTLYIPQYAWNKFSPFEKQYWEIKAKNWDTVVFFRKGKFYELFENDACKSTTPFPLKHILK